MKAKEKRAWDDWSKPEPDNSGRFWLAVAVIALAALFALIVGLPIVASVNGAQLDFRRGFEVAGQIVCIGVPIVILAAAFTLFADWINRPQ